MLMRKKEYIVYRITRASFGRLNLIDIKYRWINFFKGLKIFYVKIC